MNCLYCVGFHKCNSLPIRTFIRQDFGHILQNLCLLHLFKYIHLLEIATFEPKYKLLRWLRIIPTSM